MIGRMTGLLPRSIGSLSQLRTFKADYNQLQGTVTRRFIALLLSWHFCCCFNAIDSTRGWRLRRVARLRGVCFGMAVVRVKPLDRSHLPMAQVPDTMGGLRALTYLVLSYNQFTGWWFKYTELSK